MQIAFYGEDIGHTGLIGNLVSMAYLASVQKGYCSLILEARFAAMDLDYALLSNMDRMKVRESSSYFYEVGLDAVIRESMLGLRKNEQLLRHAIEIKRHQLYYMPGTYKSNQEVYQQTMLRHLENIIHLAEQASDLLFINCGDRNDHVTKQILEHADLIVYNLVQTPKSLDILEVRKEDYFEKTIFLIGQYDADSRLHLDNIRRRYAIPKNNIATVPYNVHFLDALTQGNAIRFIERNLERRKKDYHYQFIQELLKSSQMLLREVGLRENKEPKEPIFENTSV